MALKEDSFKEPAHGYTPEQWMAIPYRKRRYITLRDRARAATSGNPTQPATPTQSLKVPPADVAAPEAEPEFADEPETDDGDELPVADLPPDADAGDETNYPVSQEYLDKVIQFVTNNPGSTREAVSDFLATTFGDRINTQGEINAVIRQSVQNGDIEFNEDDVAVIPGSEAAPVAEPSATDIADIDADSTSDARRSDRQKLLKKFLKWRQERAAGAPATGEPEPEGDEEETDDGEEHPLTKADTVLNRRDYRRIGRSGVEDHEAASVED